MKRRNFILGAGATVAASGAVIGSGAFSTSAAFGTVDVTVEGEDVEVYDSHTQAQNAGSNDPISTIDITGDPSARRVNVQQDTFGLHHANSNNPTFEINVEFVQESGSSYSSLDNAITNVVDFRLLSTGVGTRNNVSASAQYIEDDASNLRGDSYPDAAYNDQNGDSRTYVPGLQKNVDSNGSITLGDQGDTAQIATIVTLGDVDPGNDTFEFPDLLIDITEQ